MLLVCISSSQRSSNQRLTNGGLFGLSLPWNAHPWTPAARDSPSPLLSLLLLSPLFKNWHRTLCYPRLASNSLCSQGWLNSCSSCLHLLNAGSPGVCYHGHECLLTMTNDITMTPVTLSGWNATVSILRPNTECCWFFFFWFLRPGFSVV